MKLIGISEDVATHLRIGILSLVLESYIHGERYWPQHGNLSEGIPKRQTEYTRHRLRMIALNWVDGRRSTNIPSWAYPVLESADYTAPKDWR